MYKKILVAVDGSENSIRAAQQAAHIASLCIQSKVDLLYILDYNRRRIDIITNIKRDDLHIDRERGIASIETIFINKDISHEFIIKLGDPGPTIVSYANEGDYDLVVIGSRGLNSFQVMVIGSVSHKVAKRITAPILIVK